MNYLNVSENVNVHSTPDGCEPTHSFTHGRERTYANEKKNLPRENVVLGKKWSTDSLLSQIKDRLVDSILLHLQIQKVNPETSQGPWGATHWTRITISLSHEWYASQTEKTFVRSGIRTHAWRTRLRPERSALDRSAILTLPHTGPMRVQTGNQGSPVHHSAAAFTVTSPGGPNPFTPSKYSAILLKFTRA